MSYKYTIGIKWSNLELQGLLEDEDSYVTFEKIQKHFALHPYHLTNLQLALDEILNANLYQFDNQLKGIIIAYRNPKLLSSLGDILHDTCFIHVNIEADFYIFRPEIGKTLKGFVNKKSDCHIGLLVHKMFNISVPKPENDEEENHLEEEEWVGHKLHIGQQVRVTLTQMNFSSNIPYFRGEIKEEDYLNGTQVFDENTTETEKFNKNDNLFNNSSKITYKRENKHFLFNSDSEPELKQEEDSHLKKPRKRKLDHDGNTSNNFENRSPKKKLCKTEDLSETVSSESEKTIKTEIKIKKWKENSEKQSDNDECTPNHKPIDDQEKLKKKKNEKEKKSSSTKIMESDSDTGGDSKAINNSKYSSMPSDNEEQNHKAYKKKLKQIQSPEKIKETDSHENNVEISIKKKKHKNLVDKDTIQDEKEHKKKIKKLNIEDGCKPDNYREESISSPKKKKKHSSSSHKIETDNETESKSNIKKISKFEKDEDLNSTVNQKNNFLDPSSLNDTEDEKNHKAELKKHIEKTEKKRRKIKTESSEISNNSAIENMSGNDLYNTEDEKNYKAELAEVIKTKKFKQKKNKSDVDKLETSDLIPIKSIKSENDSDDKIKSKSKKK